MADPDIKHFLVIYDIKAGHAETLEYEGDYDAAIEAYDEHEEAARDDANLDIVLLSADSIETIKRTHSSYFVTRTFESLLPAGVIRDEV